MRRRSAAFAFVLTGIVVAGALGVAWGFPGRATAARLTDQALSTVAIGADTLPPPTSLTAVGGPTASLAWVPSVAAETSGYEIWRGIASGGPYLLVGTATPGSATAGTDDPGVAGTYAYVLRSVFQNWRSVDSNEASATIVLSPLSTGFTPCGAAFSGADTGGDGDGYETDSAEACAGDGLVATDTSTGTAGRSAACANPANDRHRFGGFAIAVPPSVSSVEGIEVRLEAGLSNNGGTSALCVELSWDGGTSWTAPQSIVLTTATLGVYAFGGPTDPWDRTWVPAELADAAFRVRVTNATTHPNKDYLLDSVAVEVTYTP